MSNHFTGLRLGPPEGDTRLDLTDLYAFQSPADASRTVVILNTNTFTVASEFHPNAVYRINIDTNGDDETEISFIQTFSEPQNGRQTVTVHLAKGADARSDEPAAAATPSSSDFAGILRMFDHGDGRNFTALNGPPSPSGWTGADLFANQNCFSMIFEFPTSLLSGNPVRIWGRVSVRKNGQLVAVDRAGHPNLANFFLTDQVKPQFDADVPANDRARYLDLFLESMEHVGGYSRDEALAVLDGEALLPDMLSYDPSKPIGYPNGRLRTDHIIANRLHMLSNGKFPPDGLKPHTDLLDGFPYLGTPHERPDPAPA